jgi:hypothetical protein
LKPQGVIVQVNGGSGDLQGDIYMNPSYLMDERDEDGTLVVRNRLFFELFVFDPEVGEFDGAGIDRVEFEIFCPNGEYFAHTEVNPRYCSFGGGDPNCSVVRLRWGDTLPGTSCAIEDDIYFVSIVARPSDPDREAGNWNFSFRPELP